jgi:hypothetical protein
LVVYFFALLFWLPSHLLFWVATSHRPQGTRPWVCVACIQCFCHYAYHCRLCSNVELSQTCTKFGPLQLGVSSVFSFPWSSS